MRSSGAAGAQAEQERRRFLRDEERRQLAEAFPQHAAAQPNEAREEGIETAFAQHTASRQFRRGAIGPNEVDYATRVYGGATSAADYLPAGTKRGGKDAWAASPPPRRRRSASRGRRRDRRRQSERRRVAVTPSRPQVLIPPLIRLLLISSRGLGGSKESHERRDGKNHLVRPGRTPA